MQMYNYPCKYTQKMQILDKFRVNICLYNICDPYEEFLYVNIC